MSEHKNLSALERLAQEFEQTKSEGASKKQKAGKKPRKNTFLSEHKKKFLLASCVMVVAGLAVILGSKALQADKPENSSVIRDMPAFLNEEEQEDWKNKKVDNTEIYVYVNTKLEVEKETNEVALRLANPPYSAYPLKVMITLKENGEKVLYESKLLEPGESMEKAKLSKLPKKAGDYEAIIAYTFFAEDKTTVVGEHKVEADLTVYES